MRDLSSILTPSAILDTSILERNTERAVASAKAFGLPIRAHLKTAKSAHVAALLTQYGIERFAVSTIAEAEAFATAGYSDIMYTTAITPDKVEKLVKTREQGAQPIAVLDDLYMAKLIAEACIDLNEPLPVMIELDLDGNRCGIAYPGSGLDNMLELIDTSPGLSFAGIMTYSGATYSAKNDNQMQDVCEHHCAAFKSLENRFADERSETLIMSSGGSPMGLLANKLEGLNELRMGIFYFSDLFQAGLGIGDHGDIALSVLTSVLSVQPHYNRFIIDAGGLALSQDRSTAGNEQDWGFGRVCDIDGVPIEDLFVSKVSQEHGVVISRSGLDVSRLVRPSQKLRILPNHACITAAAYRGYELTHPDENGQEWWDRINGWYA